MGFFMDFNGNEENRMTFAVFFGMVIDSETESH